MSRVVIVEDERWLADCYARWLRTNGHNATICLSAQEAIDTIDDNPPQLIIVDLFLPGANGVQLLHELRSHADLQHIPVIVCSSAVPSPLPSLRAYGVQAVLDKTIMTAKSFCHVVNEVLQRHVTV